MTRLYNYRMKASAARRRHFKTIAAGIEAAEVSFYDIGTTFILIQ